MKGFVYIKINCDFRWPAFKVNVLLLIYTRIYILCNWSICQSINIFVFKIKWFVIGQIYITFLRGDKSYWLSPRKYFTHSLYTLHTISYPILSSFSVEICDTCKSIFGIYAYTIDDCSHCTLIIWKIWRSL